MAYKKLTGLVTSGTHIDASGKNTKATHRKRTFPLHLLNIIYYLIAFHLLLIIVVLTYTAIAATITVDDDGGSDHTTIQGALDEAVDGDVILVREGVYVECFYVNDTVELIGDGSENTRIEGGGKGDIINITADDVLVTGFHLNNSGTGWGDGRFSAVKVFGNNVTVRNNYMTNVHSAINGRGCRDCVFQDNTAYPYREMGILITNGEHNVIRGNRIFHCQNGIFLNPSNYTIIEDNHIVDANWSSIDLRTYSNHNIIRNNYVRDSGYFGGGGYALLMRGSEGIGPTNNTWIGNYVTAFNTNTNNLYGMGIKNDCHFNKIINNTFMNHSTGLRIEFMCFNNTIEGNEFTKNGNGIYFYMDTYYNVIRNNYIHHNSQGMYLRRTIHYLQVENNTVVNNNGHGIHVVPKDYWGKPDNRGSHMNITGNIISYNGANGIDIEGGKDIRNRCPGDWCPISHINITDNIISRNGGYGIWLKVSDNDLVRDNTIIQNGAAGLYTEIVTGLEIAYNTLLGNTIGIQMGRYTNSSYSHGNLLSGNDIGILTRDIMDGRIEYNSLHGNDVGIGVQGYADNVGIGSNNILNNMDFGLDATQSQEDGIDARNNWWGHESGPYHHDTNPDGKGDNITDKVIYEPWITEAIPIPPACYIESIDPREALQGDPVHFQAHGSDDGSIRCYVWQSDIQGEIFNGTVSAFTKNDLSFGDHRITLRVQDNDGLWSQPDSCSLIIRKVIFVDDDAPAGGNGTLSSPFNSIQDAIDSAASGEIIRIWNGTYHETISIDRPVVLIGNSSAGTHIVGAGDDSGSVVTVTADDVTIRDVMISESGRNWEHDAGIKVLANDTNILQVVCTDNNYGIFIQGSAGCLVEDSACISNYRIGIYLENSPDSLIERNNISNNRNPGIMLRSSGSSAIIDNILCENHYDAIWIGSSPDTILSGNTMTGTGVDIYEFYNEQEIDDSNTVNGAPLCYYKNINSETEYLVQAGAGQIILANCSNLLIQDQECSNTSNGILVFNSHHNIIRNNTCSDNQHFGIYLRGSSFNNIENNSCSSNYYYGIWVMHSDGNIIKDNHLDSNSYHGLEFRNSHSNIITGNHILSNKRSGINIIYSDENRILNNEILFNSRGIYLELVYGNPSLNITVHYNTIADNSDFGIDAEENNGQSVDARFNWWGDTSGPYNAESNPEGTGNDVTSNVVFQPWLRNENWGPIAFIQKITPSPGMDSDVIEFTGSGISSDSDSSIVRYAWFSSQDGLLYTGPSSVFNISGLSIGDHIIALRIQNDTGVWSEDVNATLTIRSRPVAIIDGITPNPSLGSHIIIFQGTGITHDSLARYVWSSSIDGELWNETYHGHQNISDPFSYPVEIGFSRLLSYGIHEISFSVQDTTGLWSNIAYADLIITSQPEVFIHVVTPSPARVGQIVTFIGTGIDDGEIEQWSWISDRDGLLGETGTIQIASLSRGEHTITLMAIDNHGFWSDPVNVTIFIYDEPEAIIEMISPSPATTEVIITFQGNGTGDYDIIRYRWESNIDGLLYNGTDMHFIIKGMTHGEHTITLRVMDMMSLWSGYTMMKLIVSHPDPEAPSLIILSPASGTTVRGMLMITGKATDNEEIETVLYRFQDSDQWFQISGSGNWYISIDTTAYPDGEHILEFLAFDGYQYSVIQSITITIDNFDDHDDGTVDVGESNIPMNVEVLALCVIILMISAIPLIRSGRSRK